jgi:hypothetical protein
MNQSKIEVILTAIDRGLSAGLRRAEDSINLMTSAVTRLLIPLGIMGTATVGLSKLVTVSREFDKISAGLITATGSADGALKSFEAIQDFATKTPYDLAQVTDSFIQLVNYGLDPSEKALTSYGNTSSALGKDLGMMIEAVADAATGEFERLKEFGIKSQLEGDKVSFTFRGITTTVGKNAADIQQYLIKLGETNFCDAMAERMKTLDGALSNLGDEWNKVFLNLSKAGIGNLIADMVRTVITGLEELNGKIASGELEMQLRALVGQFAGWANDVTTSIDLVGNYFTAQMDQTGSYGSTTVDFLVDAFRRFPENVRAFVGIIAVDMAAGFDKVMALARVFKTQLKASFTNPGDTTTLGSRLARENAIIDQAREASIDAILAERDASIKSTDDQRAAAKKLRAEYDAQQLARKKAGTDRLAGYKISGDGTAQSTGTSQQSTAAAKKAATETEKQAKAVAKLASEKLRAASQNKILAMELEKLEAARLPTILQRAEAELAISRKVMAEKLNLKRQEVAALKALEGVDPAEIIRAESELAGLRVEAAQNSDAGSRSVANANLTEKEDAWRRGTASVQQYRQAVQEAMDAGVLIKEDADRRMILSGDNMVAAGKLGFADWVETFQTDAELASGIVGQVGDSLINGLGNAFTAAIDGSKKAKDAILDLGRSTLQMVAQMILQQILYNTVKAAGSAFGFGMADGGPVQALAGGGAVTGWSPHSRADNIPIMATAREFMQPVAAVDYYGVGFMEQVRRRMFPRDLAHALAGGTLPRIPSSYRLADGGQVPGQAPQTTVKSGDTKLRVINVLDKNMVGDFLTTADGETAIINMIRRNGNTIRTIIGG